MPNEIENREQDPKDKTIDSRAKFTADDVQRVMSVLMDVPRGWYFASIGAALLSLIEYTRGSTGESVHLRVTWLTVSFFALTWLPLLLKVLALAGGGVKTSFGEANTGGLLDILRGMRPQDQQVALSTTLAAVELSTKEQPELASREMKVFTQAARSQLQRNVPENVEGARKRLRELANEYAATRQALSYGRDRRIRMTAIVNQAMAVATRAEINATQLDELMRLDPEVKIEPDRQRECNGGRIIAISAMRAEPRSWHLGRLLEIIENPASAFEQWNALEAVRHVMALVENAERRQAMQRLTTAYDKGIIHAQGGDSSRTDIYREIKSRWSA